MVYTSDYPIFSVTVDVVCLTVRDGDLRVLLVERGTEPFRGRLALPGGFVEVDEDLAAGARRELREETGIEAPGYFEQLKAYGRPDRDPRGRTVSVAYLAIAGEPGAVAGGSDAAAAGWHSITGVLADPDTLAFDHAEIITDALARTRAKLAEWSAGGG